MATIDVTRADALGAVKITDDRIAADCEACGAEATHDEPVYAVALVDDDGRSFDRLCGDCLLGFESHHRRDR